MGIVDEDVDELLIVCASAVVFLFIFCASDSFLRTYAGTMYSGLSKKKRLDWMERLMSTVHAVLVFALATYALVMDTQLRDEPVWSNSSVAVFTLATVIGYMAADMLIVVWNYSYIGQIDFVYHHLLSASTCYFVLSYRAFEYFALWRILTELSTPFLNLRFCLADADLRQSRLYIVTGLLFTGTFMLTRVLAVPHYYYVFYTAYGTPAFVQAGKLAAVPLISALAMDAVNMMWARKVVRGFLKFLKELGSSTSEAGAVEAVAPLPASSKGLKAN